MKPIKNSQQLADVCQRCLAHDFVTVDTEFVRVDSYWPKLCLIQLASPEEAVIVDALADNLDLAPVFDLMKNESVLKVFHSGRQDIEIFVNMANIIPRPVFDTQIAAMVCGFGNSVSYENLVLRTNGSAIDKSSQFTDWSIRPLTDKQLKYAISDVTYLRDAYQFLNSELVENNRIHWIKEEMETLTNMDTYLIPPNEAWKRIKKTVRKPVEFALMQELASWREVKAKKLDKTRKFVLEDEQIYEIAIRQPKNLEELKKIRGVTNAFIRSEKAMEIIGILKRVQQIPTSQLPEVPPKPNQLRLQPDLVDMLKILLKFTCEKNGVAPKIIAAAADLQKIANGQDKGVTALTGWRREIFGENALKLRNGEIGLGFQEKRIVLVPCEKPQSD